MKIVKKISSKLVIMFMTLCLFISFSPNITAFADSFKVVTLGGNLTQDQKNQMLDYFKVTKNDANILEITTSEEQKYLGNVASPAQLGNKSISCSYVEPTSKGGLTISTYNLTWVTEGMIRNALITAGVENANVIAAAPFKVSGTAALTGILKGFENSSAGSKIDESKKEVANEEIVVTGDLGDKIGQDEAAQLINDVKKDVVKEKPKTDKEIEKIVEKAVKEYKVELSNEDRETINSLMTKINGLDLNYNKIKNQLNDAASKLKEQLNSEEAQGFFAKVKEFFANFFKTMSDWFSNDSTTDTSSTKNNTESVNTENSVENNNLNETTGESHIQDKNEKSDLNQSEILSTENSNSQNSLNK
ncbi:DUF1002 domain-containing protein [Clostridium botulinum]|uniref:DUF1002 domain-containing protein n=1 Tax=Clostridium botulinum TaxID=1491 RepID=UPI0005977AA1|nr:DUF1002 domain-containing protein [Clostridium botulinum]KIL07781.1 hypothetical protein SR42_01660 [Clostridium botulinum]MBN1065754.1 DUF1002 domain-containing protein [Clostridium botulinum]MBN1072118.1 DUF1002 domain-containing protein [Clostridium botulinum]MBY6929202.1 DUF1002 domain-containing protein [Clostridium botulinum]MBY6933897.1 DUF1002 domain-containing protein [Clostridium botulinum]